MYVYIYIYSRGYIYIYIYISSTVFYFFPVFPLSPTYTARPFSMISFSSTAVS